MKRRRAIRAGSFDLHTDLRIVEELVLETILAKDKFPCALRGKRFRLPVHSQDVLVVLQRALCNGFVTRESRYGGSKEKRRTTDTDLFLAPAMSPRSTSRHPPYFFSLSEVCTSRWREDRARRSRRSKRRRRSKNVIPPSTRYR